MEINIEKVYWMIKQNEWMETDDRHSEGFRSGVKSAHKSLKVQLEDFEKRNKSKAKGK